MVAPRHSSCQRAQRSFLAHSSNLLQSAQKLPEASCVLGFRIPGRVLPRSPKPELGFSIDGIKTLGSVRLLAMEWN